MKKLMILGSHKYFENLVVSAKNEDIYTIVCDDRKDTPAKKICDEYIDVSVLELDKLKKIAREKKIDGILTSFSDELMKPYAHIADELNLPCVINSNQLESVTNKVIMKEVFEKNNIPSMKYWAVDNLDEVYKLNDLVYPLVIKPSDSSGSKGVYFVNNLNELEKNFNKCKSESMEGIVLIEEFYESSEIQGLAWVNDGESHLLYVGDRELVNIHHGRSGKPRRLLYPSIYCYQYEKELRDIYQNVANAFGIKNGPLYIQVFVGKDGLKVNEIMTRLPGGCDYLAIKSCTGFDVARLMVNFCVGKKINFDEVKKVKMRLNQCACILPIYLKEGIIKNISGFEQVRKMNGVIEVFLEKKENDVIRNTGDMKQDIGRIFYIANNLYDAEQKMKLMHKTIKIVNDDGVNMIENFI